LGGFLEEFLVENDEEEASTSNIQARSCRLERSREISGFVPASRTTSRDFRFVSHDNMELAAWCRQLLWMLEIGGLVIKI